MAGRIASARASEQTAAPEPDELGRFAAFVERMRKVGATRVRGGAAPEVAFGDALPVEPPTTASGSPARIASLTNEEREELDDLRRFRRMQEELP